MEITLNKARIEGLVKSCALLIEGEFRDASSIEILVALSQMLGRLINAQEGTTLLHNDLIKLAHTQIHEAVKAGYAHQSRYSGELVR
jgi:hypothetical protein